MKRVKQKVFLQVVMAVNIQSLSLYMHVSPQKSQFISTITSNYVHVHYFFHEICYNNVTVNHVLIKVVNFT